MIAVRKLSGALLLAFCCLSAQAQYDGGYDTVDEWTLDLPEEEEPGPQHKEYKNAFYLQYSPSQYLCADVPHMHFQEYMLGYKRNVQVMEDTPFFVEAGLNMKYGYANATSTQPSARALTFRIPINVLYKFYFSKEKDNAIAPYAGVSCRAIAMAKAKENGETVNLLKDGGWKWAQISWQFGLRFYSGRYFAGVSYSRDFRDSSKDPDVHECGVHVGCSF